MKKLFCLTLLVAGFAILSVNAQKTKIPVRVTSGFHAKYPTAMNVNWRNKLTGFEADFVMNGKRCEARFNRRGEWKETDIFLTANSLPVNVKDGFRKSKYRNWEVRSSYVRYFPGQKARYHLRVAKNDLNKKELLFSAQGQLLDDNMTI